MRCEHCSNHQMRRTPREPLANPPLPPLQGAHVLHKGGNCAPRAGRCPPSGNRAVNSQPGTGQSTSYGDVKPLYGGAGGWDRRGCATGAPKSANRQGEEQHRHTERGSHTRRDKGEHSKQGGGAQRGRRGNQNSGNRELEWRGWQSVRMGGSDNKRDGLASQPRRYRVPGQPLLNQHQVGGCLPQPRWAVCATGAGAHQGQTSREGEKDIWWTAGTARGETGHLGLTHTETQRGRLRTACGQRRMDSKNSQTTPATTSTSSIRQLLGAADAQTAHQLLGSANAETTPARAPAAAADRKQQPDEGKNG